MAAIYDIRSLNQVVVWRRTFDDGGAVALEARSRTHAMEVDTLNREAPDTNDASANRVLPQEVERLRAEATVLKVARSQMATKKWAGRGRGADTVTKSASPPNPANPANPVSGGAHCAWCGESPD